MKQLVSRSLLSLLVAGCLSAHALNVFHVGNSLTDETYAMHNIAKEKGETVELWGRMMIPGAPLRMLWDNVNGGGGRYLVRNYQIDWSSQNTSVADMLKNNRWDALVLQVFWQNGDDAATAATAARNFAGLAYQKNPDCRVYILESHQGPNDNWSSALTKVTSIYEPVANAVSAAYPTHPPTRIVPVMQVINQLRLQVAQGSNTVLGSAFDRYFQGPTDIHLSPDGLYLAALTCYATVYRENPVGAVTSGLSYWMYKDGYSVQPAYATAAQNLVWDVVKGYPLAGVQDVTHTVRMSAPGHRVLPQHTTTTDLRGRLVGPVTENSLSDLVNQLQTTRVLGKTGFSLVYQ